MRFKDAGSALYHLHQTRYDYLRGMWLDRFPYLEEQAILGYVSDVISRHRVLEAGRIVHIYDVMITGCLETFHQREQAKKKDRQERKEKLEQALLSLSEEEREGDLGKALRAECEKELSQMPLPKKIPPYLVEALWWIHHCVKQLAKKRDAVSQQAKVTWNIRTEWSEINDSTVIFEPWLHNKGRQKNPDYLAKRKLKYRNEEIARSYWNKYSVKRQEAASTASKKPLVEASGTVEQGSAKGDQSKEREKDAEDSGDELIQVGQSGEEVDPSVHAQTIRRLQERNWRMRVERGLDKEFPSKAEEMEKPTAIQDEEKIFLWRNVPLDADAVIPRFHRWKDLEGETGAGKLLDPTQLSMVPPKPAKYSDDDGFYTQWKPPPESWKYQEKGEAMRKCTGDEGGWESFYNNQ